MIIMQNALSNVNTGEIEIFPKLQNLEESKNFLKIMIDDLGFSH